MSFPKLIELKKWFVLTSVKKTISSSLSFHHHDLPMTTKYDITFLCMYLPPKIQHPNLRIPHEVEQIAS